MLNLTRNYNDLIPPSNPDFPWTADKWQLLCYYCAEPIRMTPPYAGNRQRTLSHWEHSDGKYNCRPEKLRPASEIDDPRCHCGTQRAETHIPVCSSVGKPVHHATPMSAKEQELITIYGWTPQDENTDATHPR